MTKMTGINYELINQINETRKGHNFREVKIKIGEDRPRQLINTLYPRFPITEIESIMGISDSTLERWFEQLKIPFIRNHISSISIPGDANSQKVIMQGTAPKKLFTIKITPELAYAIGFTLGDGSVQKWAVEVFNKDESLRKVLLDYLEPYGSITQEERQNGLWRLRLSNGKIANLIKNEKGIRQDTLDYIFNNEELTRRFIAAFWDAEGSVLRQIKGNSRYYHIYLYNSNKYLIGKICSFLNSKNIKFSIHERMIRNKPNIFQGHVIKSTKGLARINIHKISWATWLDTIGLLMHHSKKRRMVGEIMSIMRIEKNGN